MNESDEGKASEALEDEALEKVSGGTGGVAHELTHTVQQHRSGAGANESITVGGSQSISVGAPKQK